MPTQAELAQQLRELRDQAEKVFEEVSRLTRIIRDVDVTRPTTPTGLATGPISATSIILTWNASTDPQGAATEANSGLAGYKVYRNGSLRTTLGLTTSFGDTGLSEYTQYSYAVAAFDAAGNESIQSSVITPRTLDSTAPTAPAITATATGQTTLSVALTTASTDAHSGVSTYRLEYKRNVDSTWTLDSASLTSSSFPRTISGLTASTLYDTRCRATDVSGNVGGFSATSQATTSAGSSTNPIASSRRTDWSQAGATIVNRTTRHGSVIAAGATAATINAAIASAPDNTYIELGAGTFQIGGLSVSRSNVTIRGQGMSTIIDFNNGAQDDTPWIWPQGCPFAIQPNPAYNGDVIPAIGGAPSGPVTINGTGGVAGSFPAGSTIMNLASSPGWAVGDAVCIVMKNYADSTLPRAGFFIKTKN